MVAIDKLEGDEQGERKYHEGIEPEFAVFQQFSDIHAYGRSIHKREIHSREEAEQ